MDAEVLDIMFHHGENFERGKDGRWTYTPDNKHCLGDQNVDRLDVFYLRNYFKELGYETMKEVWWQVPGMSLEVGLRRLDSDNERGGYGAVVVVVAEGAAVVEGRGEEKEKKEREGRRGWCRGRGWVVEGGAAVGGGWGGGGEPEIVEGQDVVVHVDDQVRDLGEQAKLNSSMVKGPPVKPTTEKVPLMSLSMPKPKTVPKPKPRTRRYYLRSLGKGFSKSKGNAGDHVVLSSESDSHDSYESAKDKAYKPQEPNDSSDESGIGYTVPSHKKKFNKPNPRKKVQAESGKKKGRPRSVLMMMDLWKTFLMKMWTSDLWGEGERGITMTLLIRGQNRMGARFGELHLEVGMKFNTKWEFKEAVREFTIQEGRRMRFRKNDGKRVRAVWKVKDYKWVVYASRDHEDSCWQVKTFFNDHTCPREDRNMAANRN
ncbi:hypothetical protein Ahy_A07g034699 [Arachis hypogaea]|uniref:Uncharacterized protein n=1 Tax=Arachis hypogaea TaxID=3818 RepID=A0A445CCG8_ARAHY|nr:hypothetical protein Ahy_A07g034699 [Arachis hypogaea]